MKRFTTLLGAVLLAASAAVVAQAPAPAPKDTPKAASGPKAESPRREAFRQARDKARKACEGKPAAEQGDCMRREMCAQSADPAKCEARAKDRAARRAKMREACKDKQGEELKACIREHRKSSKK